MKKTAVVAFGGNALLRGNQVGTIEQQEQNTYNTCINLIELMTNGNHLVITHGNGPQVGNILLRNLAGYDQYKIPRMPLDICVADSQGGIGYMIERQLRNVIADHSINKNVATVITQVVVDINDSAFQNPTKPVGAFYLKEEAELLAKSNGWIFREDPRKRGWRRVVASPSPVEVLNKKTVTDLLEKDNIVIAVGGGGIPVYKDEQNKLRGVEAVIDKDLASAVLAKEISAESFYILTDVSKVYINFNKPDQQAIDKISVKEIKEFYQKGEFAAGSMGPKILAAINFLEDGGKEVIITEASKLADQNYGTKIFK
ncbi:MAG: carbamate kinase [Ignavibacteriales bacterium]|nr:MAG: carbamate kinase [Ignavibacteriales bacterium]